MPNQLGFTSSLSVKKTLQATLITSLVAFSQASGASDFYALDEAVPNDRVKQIAPVFDFDGDGCLPAAGISRSGEQNAGLNTSGSLGGDCRTQDFLNYSNTLHRSKCVTKNNDEYCGHFYSLYFEKDQVVAGWDIFGHRHDWEVSAVWTKNGVITHGGVSAHGNMTNRAIGDIERQGEHIRVVYHKDGPSTHALRFAKDNEAAENPYDEFVTPPITSWYNLYGDNKNNAQMRALLNTYNYDRASIPMKDSNFISNLNRYRPSGYPEFLAEANCEYSNWFSEEGSARGMCAGEKVAVGIQCSGRYCDNKRIKCCSLPGAIPSGGTWESNWFSEEGSSSWAWNGAAVVGMRCSGRYCDNIKLILRSLSSPQGNWTGSFSEEQGLGQCSPGQYIAGIRCSGRYCDNLSLYCQK